MPFKVVLNSKMDPIELPFYENVSSVFNDDPANVPYILEYYYLNILFLSENPLAKLYIDCLDLNYTDRVLINENNERFIHPSEEEFPIIEESNSHIESILVPGYYQLKVVDGNKTFYSGFEVRPKSLTKTQWMEMKEEIESILKGISLNYNRKNLSSSLISQQYHHKIDYIKKMYKRYIDITKEIAMTPPYRLEKKYAWKEVIHNPIVDNKSIQKKLEKPEKHEHLYSPSRYLNYNTRQNKWLKNIIYRLNEINNGHISYFEAKLFNINKQISSVNIKNSLLVYLYNEKTEITELLSILKKIKAANYFLMEHEWFSDIPRVVNINPNPEMMMNKNYNFYYKWFLKMTKKESHIILPNSIQYAWKRTDILFEIWTYLKLMETIEIIGFEPQSGWIYNTDDFIVPDLIDNTYIKYIKNDIILNLHYNTKLNKNSKNTSLENPLFTKSANNKPDIRMDIFFKSEYIGSIIIDTKYRSLKKIITGNSVYKNNAMEQLRNYKNHPASLKYFYPNIPTLSSIIKPIKSVWVLYPNDPDDYDRKKELIEEEEGIYFFEISPRSSMEHIKNELNREINSLIESYNQFSKWG
ncbi:hypothetical protein L2Z53_00380 [Macrococcoides canis]|uniref:nuclease domain-containing protein n=1 Tax=Macrococcoides canis TaxID=1855823 RepID=UPI001F34936D|nr:nuclease domain-containing protein [Macrococcus canis]UJS27850.1 hypothetical protein L2Z53_00380 [Macrococcus canis]